MSLLDQVRVARRFQRSIKIDADLHDPKALDGFVCPRSSAEVLLTMARHVADTGHAAFTWTGPYGSGKSSLVVALSAALGGSPAIRKKARDILGKPVADAISRAMPPKDKGWRILPVVGQRSSAADAIGAALVANGFVPKGAIRRWTDDRVLDELCLAAAADSKNKGGLLVFLDEMGKFLEGAAHDGLDIYLFQRLAEAAARSTGRLVVVGILHQSFDEYAQRLAREQRDEWAKVQGRFVDLIVNAAGDEQIELLSRAFETEHRPKRASKLSQTIADTVRAGRPSSAPDLASTLESCWPLHPVVACLLGPISRRRFGQNQRSLFGFLNSAEPFGFQDFLRDASDSQLFDPERLWNYLRTNLEPAILASPDGHRWSMAVEAIERCDAIGGTATQLRVLKAIALLDLFRERSGLLATDRLLATCVGLTEATGVGEALKQLQAWSFIAYRKHLGAYAVHAGSDFDLEQALSETLNSIREVDLRQLRALAGLQPILAKRHYHETGALRWFDVDLAPLSEIGRCTASDDSKAGAIGRFVLVVPTGNESRPKAQAACQDAARAADDTLALGLSGASWQVLSLGREFLALSKIQEERPELSGDSVARREVEARLSDVRSRLEHELQKMLDTAEWYRRSGQPARLGRAELNTLASELADKRYPAAPKLPNELLNRENPSSNAVAAQKNLLRLMVQREGEPRLSIEGYPAEGGLFDSIVLKSGLYRLTSQGWRFAPPAKGADTCGLLPCWKAGAELLERNPQRSVSMAEVFAIWKRPPFGIKDGLLPVIGVAFLLAHRDRLAFYREGIFQSRFSDLDVDYLANDPSTIQLRWMDLSDLSRKLLSGLADVVRKLDGENRLVHLAPIDVARGLVAIHDGLKPWARRTARLSANALRIRGLFKQASDPNKFLFDDIPHLFEANGANGANGAAVDADDVIARVKDGLEELTQAYPSMLARLKQMMLGELDVPNESMQALAELRARAENVRQLTGDFQLNALVGRMTQFTGSETDMEGIASLAASKPPRDWVDADLDQAGVEIAALAQKFIRSEAFARVKGRADKRHAMAVVVGMDGKPTPFAGEFTVADRDKGAVQDVILRVQRVLDCSDTQGRNIILAALAEMSARYLSEAADDLAAGQDRVANHS